MFGLNDFSIFLVFVLCIICAIFCIIYGFLNWNKGLENENEDIKEELLWEEAEDKIKEIL